MQKREGRMIKARDCRILVIIG